MQFLTRAHLFDRAASPFQKALSRFLKPRTGLQQLIRLLIADPDTMHENREQWRFAVATWPEFFCDHSTCRKNSGSPTDV